MLPPEEVLKMWQPREDYWNYIKGLLEASVGSQSTTSNTNYSAISKSIEEFSKLPDSALYYAFIFVFDDQSTEPARGLAGLLLKNKLRASVDCLDEEEVVELLKIIKEPLLKLLVTPRSFLQRTVGSVLSTLVTDCNGLKLWPDLLSLDLMAIVSAVDIPVSVTLAVLGAIEKICEDAAFELIDHIEMFNQFLEKLLSFFENQKSNESIRNSLLSIIGHLIPTHAALLTENISGLLQCIFYKAPETESIEFKITCCRVLSILVEFYCSLLTPQHINQIFTRIYLYSSSSDTSVTEDRDLLRQCGEFWLVQVQNESATDLFGAFPDLVTKLIPLLMDRCLYNDDEDEEELCLALEDLTVPDEEEDLKPRHLSHNQHRKNKKDETVSKEDFDDEDEPEESIVTSLRKCSAATLDGLSLILDPTIFLQIFIPAFNVRVGSTNWKVREGALLALGAVAEGLCQAFDTHWQQIVPFLISNAHSHPHPLVRSMSIWSLSRISSWLFSSEREIIYVETDVSSQCWRILIGSLGDANKRVQQAAATALCKFLEEPGSSTRLSKDHLTSLISAIFLALKCYQRRSLLVLYDLIRIFGAVEFDESLLYFDQEAFQYWRSIALTLVDRIGPNSIADSSVFPIIEALMALLLLDFEGNLLEPSKRDEMNLKALNLASQNLEALKEAQDEGYADSIVSEGLDDFLIAALDLLAAGSEASGLIPSESLFPLLWSVLSASFSFKYSTNVRQSAFALIGDLAVNFNASFFSSESFVKSYLSALNQNILPSSLSEVRSSPSDLTISVATSTNAIWSLGEFSLNSNRLKFNLNRELADITCDLITILRDRPILEVGARIYFENVVVCIGRVLLVCNLHVFLYKSFLNRIFNLLKTVENENERLSALFGFIRVNFLPIQDYQFILKNIQELIDFSKQHQFDHRFAQNLREFGKSLNQNEIDQIFYNSLHPILKQILFE